MIAKSITCGPFIPFIKGPGPDTNWIGIFTIKTDGLETHTQSWKAIASLVGSDLSLLSGIAEYKSQKTLNMELNYSIIFVVMEKISK